MDPFTMVVAIVAISVGAGIINNWIKARRSWAAGMPDPAEQDRMREEIDRLTKRVSTLERIVTDQERQLSEDIRGLA